MTRGKTNFYLKKPGVASGKSKRTQFSIYKQTVYLDNSTKNETLKIKELTELNNSYKIGQISLIQATKSAKQILKHVKVQNGITDANNEVFNSENVKILNGFLEDYFKRKRYIVDKNSAKNKFTRAVVVIGKLSLNSATEDDLLSCVLSKSFDDNKKRDLIAKLNSILKWLKRDLRLHPPMKVINDVVYLTENEVIRISESVNSDTVKHFILLSFYSGLRIGEAYTLTNNSLRVDNTINVDTQLDIEGKKRLPKNRKKRKAFINEQGINSFKIWVNTKDKIQLSRNAITKIFKKTCNKILNKNCNWHDLRHSYAVHLISQGVPIQLVAQSMGNSVKVCEEYYSGFVLSELGIDTIKQILKKA